MRASCPITLNAPRAQHGNETYTEGLPHLTVLLRVGLLGSLGTTSTVVGSTYSRQHE